MIAIRAYDENLYEAFEVGQWGSRCYSSKQFIITLVEGKDATTRVQPGRWL
jgi:hypothetical protein